MRSVFTSENGPQAMEDIDVEMDYASFVELGGRVW